ncbi:MAG: YbhB/YbcL family Raf kinase inhibitor-like protein [Candidatus Abyssubacteria bacterium]
MSAQLRINLAVAVVLILCLISVTAPDLRADESKGGNGTMNISSNAFKNGTTIPKKYTCEGEDVSPPLSWSAPPNGTKSIVLICDDPDAPVGTWVHWVLFGLSPDTTSLPEGVPAQETAQGATQGRNDFGNLGYGGPCPPPGPAHRYFFKLYAIDKELNLKPGATKAEVMKAIEGHILAEAQLMGKYGR